eukprot:CAMPEP_0177256390 /NCGR_PEP_ID=MMETSP0367-20130122/56911_1 /TAXON_ID=447022 ORGANISM="Scrippsiella hangoei-like, Strain SHHI-4" /NCGR_SAMPLE_ID=MMETSP0367 /ASSEMBLY_ACC=CAM_ASM_000362 /LENGTH=178 /DNA_ID=CAMNT_0018710261 /DNA_START=733 /DNA_END=1266 /DNA_ORIENTATION=+
MSTSRPEGLMNAVGPGLLGVQTTTGDRRSCSRRGDRSAGATTAAVGGRTAHGPRTGGRAVRPSTGRSSGLAERSIDEAAGLGGPGEGLWRRLWLANLSSELGRIAPTTYALNGPTLAALPLVADTALARFRTSLAQIGMGIRWARHFDAQTLGEAKRGEVAPPANHIDAEIPGKARRG